MMTCRRLVDGTRRFVQSYSKSEAHCSAYAGSSSVANVRCSSSPEKSVECVLWHRELMRGQREHVLEYCYMYQLHMWVSVAQYCWARDFYWFAISRRMQAVAMIDHQFITH
jgi:hypothetical protein